MTNDRLGEMFRRTGVLEQHPITPMRDSKFQKPTQISPILRDVLHWAKYNKIIPSTK